MKQRIKSACRSPHVFASIAAAAVLTVLWVPAGAEQSGTPVAVTTSTHAGAATKLESAFWHCDYAGTTGGVDTGTAVACVAITQELKNSKFNGDFEALLAWWREHKPAAHRAIEAGQQRITPASLRKR